jgi:DNA-directed RNA polymerase sigma subunit (sigma70/sigma32)
MDTKRIPRKAVRDETKRTVLREAQQRYLHELLDDDERQVLRDRVLRLRRELRLNS